MIFFVLFGFRGFSGGGYNVEEGGKRRRGSSKSPFDGSKSNLLGAKA